MSRQSIKRVADTQSEPKTEPLYSRLRDLKPNKNEEENENKQNEEKTQQQIIWKPQPAPPGGGG